MEPVDFDKHLRGKLQQSKVYQRESDQAKPFIWTEVQNSLRTGSLTWKHLAAAMIMLLVMCALLFHFSNRGHQQELRMLAESFDNLQKDYQSEKMLLKLKELQVDSLTEALKNKAPYLSETPQKERIIYITDTVMVKQVEIDNAFPAPDKTNEVRTLESRAEPIEPPVIITISPEREVDEMIYLDYSNQHGKPKGETFRVKLGTFTARKD